MTTEDEGKEAGVEVETAGVGAVVFPVVLIRFRV